MEAYSLVYMVYIKHIWTLPATSDEQSLKKRHTKSSGCDLKFSYSLLLNAVRQQQQWTSFGHSIKLLFLSRIQLFLLQDWISVGLFLYSFQITAFLVHLPFWKTFVLFFICVLRCVHTHFSMLALTFLTPFGWLNTVLVSACRQYVNTLITLDQWLVE